MGRKLKQCANCFTDRCPTWLARNKKRNLQFLQPRREPLYLCGFSAPFRSLKRDEWQPRHDVDCEIKRFACRTVSIACHPEPRRRRRTSHILQWHADVSV